MDATIDDFFTKRHKRLIDLAKIARVVSWVILVVYLFWAMVRFGNGISAFRISHLPALGNNTLWGLISLDPLQSINILVDGLSKLFTGGVFLVVLQGISLGLSMIVETNLNYQGGSTGDEDE